LHAALQEGDKEVQGRDARPEVTCVHDALLSSRNRFTEVTEVLQNVSPHLEHPHRRREDQEHQEAGAQQQLRHEHRLGLLARTARINRRRPCRWPPAPRRPSRSGRKKKGAAHASASQTGMTGLLPKPIVHTTANRNGPKNRPATPSSTFVARKFSQLRSRTDR